MKSVAGIAICAVAGFLAQGARAQDSGDLKAREMFWTRPTAPVKPVVTPTKTAPKTTATKKTAPVEVPVVKPTEPTVTATTNHVEAPTPTTRPSGQTQMIKVGYAPLALRYSILQKKGGSFVEVDPETEFHTGDLIRVRVEANDSAYLYIVMGGSSGQWRVLFPDKDINGGNNQVSNGQPCTIPPEKEPPFRFDETAGVEKVSLILSRTPEPDLEKLIYAADDHNRNAGKPKMIIAANTVVDGAFLGQVRNELLARDLVFEKYDESKPQTTPDGRMDRASYAATKDNSPNARLFVDLTLTHK